MLEELRRGGTNAEIAARLDVTLDAVKFHISNMLGKLGLDNRRELAAWRPEPRRRLFGLLAVPGAFEPLGRVVVWAGVAAAGAAAVAVAAVVLIALSTLDSGEQQLALAPTATATPTATVTVTAAATAGSYAFLTTAGDAASAIENFGSLPARGVELRIHPEDASGTSRAAYYDTIKVGDKLDYRTNSFACGFRFRVTSVGAVATSRTFGIELIQRFGRSCGDGVGDKPMREVDFVWRVRPGLPGPYGVRVLLRDEPTGEGTYLITDDLPWVIDIPAGAEIFFLAVVMNARVVGDTLPVRGAVLVDVATDSALHIDPETGEAFYRTNTSDEVDALFDQIVDSIRRVGPPP